MLSGGVTLFQQAVERLNNVASHAISVNETLVVTGEDYRFIALEQLREMPSFNRSSTANFKAIEADYNLLEAAVNNKI